MTEDELIALVTHGGGTLIFIALASVTALGLAIERLAAMRSILPNAQELHAQISRELLRGDVSMAERAALQSRALAAEIFLAGFSRWRRTGSQGGFEGAVDRARLSLLLALKKRLWAIGTIGTIAPFIGLFGTVVGIMSAFSSMAENGTGGFAVVAAGISQALVATASGIAVAIEAVIFFNFFQARLGAIAAGLKLLTDEFCELLSDIPVTPAQASLLSQTPPAPQPAPASQAQNAQEAPREPNTLEGTL